ncbi:TraE/TraK family type IV conjugative transfer system protein [Rickettsiales bacterium]|nr:TraE/TraK family type IV conjugative transfer system protein [Rickettsiales bacterium]
METNILAQRIPALIQQRNTVSCFALILMLANLILAFAIFKQKTTTIVIPSEISGTYKIVDNKVNDIFLKDRANEMVKTFLNLTPNNLEIMYETILRNAPPQNHFELKKVLNSLSKEIIGRNVSIAFFPVTTSVNSDELTADIEGEFYTFFGGKSTMKIKSYHLKFANTGNRLLLTEIYEIIEESDNA